MTRGRSRTPSGALVAILAAALLLRLAHLAAVADDPFVAHPVMDSQEYDRWAWAIAAGEEPAGAFFQAPLYPYLVGALYALFGRELLAVHLLQVAAGVATVGLVYLAARRMVSRGVGLAAAAAAAVYGPFLFYEMQLLKEPLATTAAAALLWLLAEARGRPDESRGGPLRWWAGAGLAGGILALLRENALLAVPPLVLLAFLPRRPGSRDAPEDSPSGPDPEAGSAPPTGRSRTLPGSVLAAAVFLAAFALPLLPVAARHAAAGEGFLPTSFNGGVNLWIGNNPAADGLYRPLVPGAQTPAEERRAAVRLAEEATGEELAAGEVSRYWIGRVLEWARREPGDFLALQLTKLRLFWSGYEQPDAVDYYDFRRRSPVLALPLLDFGGLLLLVAAGLWMERRRLGRHLPALAFAFAWCGSVVLFFVFARFRLPVVPALLPLAGVPLAATAAAVGGLFERRREARWRPALGYGALVVAALLLPRIAGYGPRQDLVEYNLARIYEDEGDPAAAERHYRASLAIEPRNFQALLGLGNRLARRGRVGEALPWFERAVAVEPLSSSARANLGGALLAIGEREGARRQLEEAVALDPTNPAALQNLAALELREGRMERAAELARRLLELAPGHPGARRMLERLGDDP